MPLNKPPSCYGCPLQSIGTGFSKPDGLGTLNIALIGEALGHDEAMDGLPFRPKAQSGSKLEEVIRIAGQDLNLPLTRNHFTLWNIVACQPPGDKLSGSGYEYKAIEHCKKYFNQVVESRNGLVKLRNSNIDSCNTISVGSARGSIELESNVVGLEDIHESETSRLDINANRANGFGSSFPKRMDAILALGNVPLRTLAKISGDAMNKQSISHMRGYVMNSDYGPVVGAYHPAFIKRGNGKFTPTLIEDLKKVVRVANGTFTQFPSHNEYKKPNYVTNPSLDDVQLFLNHVRNNRRLPISYDIETEETINTNSEEDERDDHTNKQIIQIQFSTAKGEGIAIPFQPTFHESIKSILNTDNHKLGFNNWSFDDPILKANGFHIGGPQSWDIMIMFAKWQPNLERGLQKVASLFNFPFPWKHLFGSELQFYGCADVDAVLYIVQELVPLMKNMGTWEHYRDQVYGLRPILLNASARGIPVNNEKREELKIVLEKRKEGYLAQLQSAVPDEIKNLAPKRKDKVSTTISYGYKNPPATIKNAEGEYLQLVEKVKGLGKTPVSFRRYVKRKYGLVWREFEEFDIDKGEFVKLWHWCKQEDFNPSNPQVIKYLRWKQKQLESSTNKDERELADYYEIPISLKTKKETTGKKELQEILEKTGDPILDKTLRIRSLTTNITNYIPNWTPDNDGCVHTEWGFLPPQEQLATRSPNIQNCSKHTEIGQEFRRIVEAPKGRVFIEFDKKSFHVATMGYCAKDSTYIRFSQLDPHSIFTSFIHPSFSGRPVDFAWSDVDILSYCKDIKSYCKKEKESGGTYAIDMRQDIAKVCVLGNQLGLGPHKLWVQNRKAIKSIEHAKELQARLAEVFPKVEQFKSWCRQLAHDRHWLMTEWGDIQWFWDVLGFRYNKKQLRYIRVNGDDAEKCLAKMVQGTAFGMIKNEIKEMDKLYILDRFGFCNTIHDSVMFIPEEREAEECIERVMKVMNAPCERLTNEATGEGGLVVKVEASMGRNWKSYDKELNPEGMREVK